MQFLWPDGLFSVYAVSCKFLFITLLISLKSKLAILILIFLQPTFLLYKSLKETCTVGLEFKHKGVPMLLLHQKQKTKKKNPYFFPACSCLCCSWMPSAAWWKSNTAGNKGRAVLVKHRWYRKANHIVF